MKDDCPSDLIVDQYLAGELTDARRSATARHLDDCPSCAELVDQRRAAAAAFGERDDLAARAAAIYAGLGSPDTAPRSRPARRPWWRAPMVWGSGLAVAAAATLAAVALLPAGDGAAPTGGQGGLRIKGKPFAIGAYLKRGGAVSRARSGQVFHAGDRLRFSYTAEAGHLALVGLDAKGIVTVYYPSAGKVAARVSKATNRALPQATVLDRTLGLESVVGIHCADRFATAMPRKTVARLAAALRRGDLRRGARAASKLLPAPGCQAALFELRKQEPSQ